MPAELRHTLDSTAQLPPDVVAMVRSETEKERKRTPFQQLDMIMERLNEKQELIPEDTLYRTSESYAPFQTHTEQLVHVIRSATRASYACENKVILPTENEQDFTESTWQRIQEEIRNDYFNNGARAEVILLKDPLTGQIEVTVTTAKNVCTIKTRYTPEERLATAFKAFSEFKLRNSKLKAPNLSVEFFTPANQLLVSSKSKEIRRVETSNLAESEKLQTQILQDFAEIDRLTALTLSAIN